jgi:hypothetical protein
MTYRLSLTQRDLLLAYGKIPDWTVNNSIRMEVLGADLSFWYQLLDCSFCSTRAWLFD